MILSHVGGGGGGGEEGEGKIGKEMDGRIVL